MVISGKYNINEFIDKIKDTWYITVSRTDITFHNKTSYHKEYVAISTSSYLRNESRDGKTFNSEQDAIDEINNILSKYQEGIPVDFIPGEDLEYRLLGRNIVVFENFNASERDIPGRQQHGYGNKKVQRKTKPFSIVIVSYGITSLPTVIK